jgi:hypothetical protein
VIPDNALVLCIYILRVVVCVAALGAILLMWWAA